MNSIKFTLAVTWNNKYEINLLYLNGCNSIGCPQELLLLYSLKRSGQKERFSLLRLTICLSIFSQYYWQYSTGRFTVLNLLHYSSQSSFLTTSDWGIESSNVALRKRISKHCSDPASTHLIVFWLLSFMTLLTKNSRLSFTKLPMNIVNHCILNLSLNDTDYFGI